MVRRRSKGPSSEKLVKQKLYVVTKKDEKRKQKVAEASLEVPGSFIRCMKRLPKTFKGELLETIPEGFHTLTKGVTNVRDEADGKTVMVVKFTEFKAMSDEEMVELQEVATDLMQHKEGTNAIKRTQGV